MPVTFLHPAAIYCIVEEGPGADAKDPGRPEILFFIAAALFFLFALGLAATSEVPVQPVIIV